MRAHLWYWVFLLVLFIVVASIAGPHLGFVTFTDVAIALGWVGIVLALIERRKARRASQRVEASDE